MKKPIFLPTILFASFIMFSFFSHAMEVKAVKGEKVLIYLDEAEEVKEGTILKVKSPSGKTVGYVKVKKVRSTKALAQIIKGRAKKGAMLEVHSSNKKRKKRFSSGHKRHALAFMGGVNYALINQDGGDAQDDVNTSGLGFRFTGAYDLKITKNWKIRAGIGYEVHKAAWSGEDKDKIDVRTLCDDQEGTNSDDENVCATEISYIRADALIRYVFGGRLAPWLGAGFSFYSPMGDPVSDIIQTDDLSSAISYDLAFGFDYKISSKLFIPMSFKFNYFAPGESVSVMTVGGQIGLGLRF